MSEASKGGEPAIKWRQEIVSQSPLKNPDFKIPRNETFKRTSGFLLAKICVSTGLPLVVRCEAADALRLDLYKSRGGGAG
jgi:hypothetical protein